MKKNIFLFWLQGWDKAPWLQNKILESWEINNPDWNIELVDQYNLGGYLSDIDYIYNDSKKITPQAISDIVRLSLLKNHGGIWADSTLLCMQPLDHWIFDAIKKSNFWMYHGHGAYMSSDLGPASWFIVSEKDSYIIKKWKESCDIFWNKNNFAKDYFWMDGLFKNLILNDPKFKNEWVKTPFLYCENMGSSHTLANYNFGMTRDIKSVKEVLRKYPPYVLKLSSRLVTIFSNLNSKKFYNSNAFFAISISTRKYEYYHKFQSPLRISSPLRKNYYLRLICNVLRKLKYFFRK